jgi:hypothetical protein
MPVSTSKATSQPGNGSSSHLPPRSKQPVDQSVSENDGTPVCAENPSPCVPEGTYLASCTSAQRYKNPRFKREEITLTLELCDLESSGTNSGVNVKGIKLKRYYAAETAGRRRSNYYREWTIANQGIAPLRGDRLPYRKFTRKLFRVVVETVRTDAYQQKLPPSLQYSKIAAILELVQTNEKIY